MPSRAEPALLREGLLRGAAFAALALATVAAIWVARSRSRPTEVAEHLTWAGAPSPLARDLAAARHRAGHPVTWQGEVAAVAVMTEALREPLPRWRIAVASDVAVAVSDSLGRIDSLPPGAALETAPTLGAPRVDAGATYAEGRVPGRASPRGVLVWARAGFEPRFTITALEEAGWTVDAVLELGRGRAVQQGNVVLRRARHDVLIAFDSAALRRESAAVLRFLREGGGVILAGDAVGADLPPLRTVRGASVVRLEPPESRSFEGHAPTHALPLSVLRATRSDASVLETRDGLPALVARRVGAGRLLQIGYRDVWRWRMEGEGRAVEEHRGFWSRLVGMAAPAWPLGATAAEEDVASGPGPATAWATAGWGADAPRAAVVHALGPPLAEPANAVPGPPRVPVWIGLFILLALLAEWGSRRRRGVP